MVGTEGRSYWLLFALAVLAQVSVVGYAFFMGLVLLPLLWVLLVTIAFVGLPLMLVLAVSGKRWQALGVPLGTIGLTILFALVNFLIALASGEVS